MIRKYSLLATIFMLSFTDMRAVSEKREEIPVYPTVFLVMREYTKQVDWYQIIRSALHVWDDAVDGSPILHIPHKHICIIDEADTWAVLFFMLENGRSSSGTGFYDFSDDELAVKGEPNRIVYLDKESLEEVSPPKGAIGHLPLLNLSLLPDNSLFFQERESGKKKGK